jgi:tRNA pseudouridine55 synthase
LSLAGAITLAELELSDPNEAPSLLRPVDSLLGEWPALTLDEAAADRFAHGQKVCWRAPTTGPLRVYCGQRFLGLGESDLDGQLQPKRLLAS